MVALTTDLISHAAHCIKLYQAMFDIVRQDLSSWNFTAILVQDSQAKTGKQASTCPSKLRSALQGNQWRVMRSECYTRHSRNTRVNSTWTLFFPFFPVFPFGWETLHLVKSCKNKCHKCHKCHKVIAGFQLCKLLDLLQNQSFAIRKTRKTRKNSSELKLFCSVPCAACTSWIARRHPTPIDPKS